MEKKMAKLAKKGAKRQKNWQQIWQKFDKKSYNVHNTGIQHWYTSSRGWLDIPYYVHAIHEICMQCTLYACNVHYIHAMYIIYMQYTSYTWQYTLYTY